MRMALDPSVLRASNHAAADGLTDRRVEQTFALIAERSRAWRSAFRPMIHRLIPAVPKSLGPLIVAVMVASAESRERHTA